MNVTICGEAAAAGRLAAREGGEAIRRALEARGAAAIVLATGASQFHVMDALVREEEIDWDRVEAFHLDEYVGLSPDHPASFRKYLKERFEERLPQPLKAFHYVRGDASDPEEECRRLEALMEGKEVDAAFVGIGENGHLAFNDPPADFETERAFLVVFLDEACRRQQVGEGWFGSLEEVPEKAISMSIRRILRSRLIVCTVPELRKAKAVKETLLGPVTPMVPASILRTHPDCRIYLDRESASLLGGKGGLPSGEECLPWKVPGEEES